MGMTSTDVGFAQSDSDPVNQSSIGLTGTGGAASAFSWAKFTGLAYTTGQPNTNQTFTVPPQPQGIAIDNLAVTFVADSDGDGFTDSDEAVFGTNPQDASSRFIVTSSYPSAGTLRLSFPTLANRSYAIEGSVNLTNWVQLADYQGTGTTIQSDVALNPQDPKRFYRVRVTGP